MDDTKQNRCVDSNIMHDFNYDISKDHFNTNN